MTVLVLVIVLVVALIIGLAIVYQMGKPILIQDANNPVQFDENGNPVSQQSAQSLGQRLKAGWSAIWWGQNLDEKQKRLVKTFKFIFYIIIAIVFLVLALMIWKRKKK